MIQQRHPGTAAPDAPGATVPLCEMREGDRGRIDAARLDYDDCELLRAMGMSEACEIEVVRSGATCIVKANATRLGLSRTMSRRILVTVPA